MRTVLAAVVLLLAVPGTARAAEPAPSYPGAPGSDPGRRTLVLYDTTGPYGWLGEPYAVQIGQLASHGGSWAMRPVTQYTKGELAGYTSVIYAGSTYDEPLPSAFLDDVLGGTRPVLWLNDNIWQLEARAGDFPARYGWEPDEFDTSTVRTIRYRGASLSRSELAAPSGILRPEIDDPALVTTVGTAVRPDGSTFPWGVRSGALTYIGEIPLSYIGEGDRYLALADVVSGLVRPGAPDRKRALVRIEDVGPDADPAELRAITDYLHSKRVPFSLAVYPRYEDPKGVYHNGVPTRMDLREVPEVVQALRYAEARGGTLLMHGYTHQYETVDNPYDAVSADDFEFYGAHVDEADYVRLDGPVPKDSALWATGRVIASRGAFRAAGLAEPTIFEPPHYAASAVDYQVFNQQFGLRYDRGLYFPGWCPAGKCGSGQPDYTREYGQYFPYLVRDVYGSTVIPEGLGNVELEEMNHHPPRLPAEIVAAAKANLAVTDGTASFFYHPYLGVDDLRKVVEGIQGLGYQFVPAGEVAKG
ncbi:DUF2334 domain-containing protein [Amycolatopsis nigrescens]|uniref:DUF2334 domain-containing protein n=1 Tax=Amycolatopsis nigrescens TaxID=381445 RepID=UPI00035F8E19|nr:polysaccharide deacetylase family protein [Amycolatopsis nigrescens]